jgi:hypothetical protein
MAGGQGQLVAGDRPQHPHVARRDDLPAGDDLAASADWQLENDLVTGSQPVEVVERLSVGGAVAGDGRLARPARQRRRRVVAGPGSKSVVARPLDDDHVESEGVAAETGEGVALVERAAGVVEADLEAPVEREAVLVGGEAVGARPGGDGPEGRCTAGGRRRRGR